MYGRQRTEGEGLEYKVMSRQRLMFPKEARSAYQAYDFHGVKLL